MDEKPIEKEGEQTVVEKKVYTPPELTLYGKLIELTAGGSGPASEGLLIDPSKPHKQKP